MLVDLKEIAKICKLLQTTIGLYFTLLIYLVHHESHGEAKSKLHIKNLTHKAMLKYDAYLTKFRVSNRALTIFTEV